MSVRVEQFQPCLSSQNESFHRLLTTRFLRCLLSVHNPTTSNFSSRFRIYRVLAPLLNYGKSWILTFFFTFIEFSIEPLDRLRGAHMHFKALSIGFILIPKWPFSASKWWSLGVLNEHNPKLVLTGSWENPHVLYINRFLSASRVQKSPLQPNFTGKKMWKS